MNATEVYRMIRNIRSDLYSAANVFNKLSRDCFDIEDTECGHTILKVNAKFSDTAVFARTLLRNLDKARRGFNKASLQLAKESAEQRRKERIQRYGGSDNVD